MSIFGRNQHLFQLFSLRSFETETYKEVGIKVGGKDQSQVVVYQAGEDSKEEKTKTKTKKQKKNTENALRGSSKSKRAPSRPQRTEPSA